MSEPPRILVVDDEPKICSLLKRLLEREGYLVDDANDGDQALKKLVKNRPDLLVTDLKMPGIDGLELVKRARSIEADLPVVLVTGYASLETAVQALREGVEDYITKPFSIAELKGVVGRILQNRRLAAENVRLLRELRVANAQLEQHRERLTRKVQAAEDDLGTVNQALERRLLEMEVLHEINGMTSTVLDQEELLFLGTKLIQDKVGVDAVAVLLLDDEERDLVVRSVRGPDEGFAAGQTFPRESGAAGLVLQRGQPLIVDSNSTAGLLSEAEQRTFGGGSFLATPLRGKELPAGVLMLSRSAHQPPFGDEEQNFLVLIAHDLATALENARLFDENERAYIDVLAGLVEAMEARDPYLQQHTERVRFRALELAEALNLDRRDREILETGARLHDLGKVGIEDRVLLKPGLLDDSEMSIMRSHPSIGDRIVKPLGKLGAVKPIIRHHHERWDGSGYPDGLKGEEIPLLAQIVALVDAFDAMTSRRPYRDAMPSAVALGIVRESSGTHFNPFLVEVFRELEEKREPPRAGGAA